MKKYLFLPLLIIIMFIGYIYIKPDSFIGYGYSFSNKGNYDLRVTIDTENKDFRISGRLLTCSSGKENYLENCLPIEKKYNEKGQISVFNNFTSNYKILNKTIVVLPAYNCNTKYLGVSSKDTFVKKALDVFGKSLFVVDENYSILIKMDFGGVVTDLNMSALFANQKVKKEGNCNKKCSYTIENFDKKKLNLKTAQKLKWRQK